jgi:hypothetical protein
MNVSILEEHSASVLGVFDSPTWKATIWQYFSYFLLELEFSYTCCPKLSDSLTYWAETFWATNSWSVYQEITWFPCSLNHLQAISHVEHFVVFVFVVRIVSPLSNHPLWISVPAYWAYLLLSFRSGACLLFVVMKAVMPMITETFKLHFVLICLCLFFLFNLIFLLSETHS